MASNQVAITLTIAYWIASVPFDATLVNYSAPWIWIGWVLAVLSFVIPLTAILWFIALLDRLREIQRLPTALRARWNGRTRALCLVPHGSKYLKSWRSSHSERLIVWTSGGATHRLFIT
jgi:MFS family permease